MGTQRESQLVLRAQLGDREAIEELLSSTQVWLRRYLDRLCGSESLTDEVLQETLIRVYRNLVFLSEPAVYRAWVYRIATREAMRRLVRKRRRGQREIAIDERVQIAADEQEPLAKVSAKRLRQHVGLLPPKSRAVVALHYFEEFRLREVADLLGVSLGTVKSRLAYGLSYLRREMNGEGA